MDYLRDKRLLAKEWLEKLKKSFSARSFNSNNRASLRKTTLMGVSSATAVVGPDGSAVSAENAAAYTQTSVSAPEKPRLDEMRQMVEEGQFICDLDGNDDTGGATGGTGLSSRTAQARELTKAQTAVSAAEEWLSRVRELLVEDEVTFAAARAQARLLNKQQKLSARTTETEADNDSNDDDDDSDDSEPEDLRCLLREMLGEAEDMPVQLDEAVVLRGHLRALDWADKARRLLPACTPAQIANSASSAPLASEKQEQEKEELDPAAAGTVDNNDDMQEESTKQTKSNNKSKANKPKVYRPPTVQELQKLVNEIKS